VRRAHIRERAKYTGGWDASNETRDYFETLLREVRKATPELKNPARLVPVGHVLADLHAQMKAGRLGDHHSGELHRASAQEIIAEEL
jgi:hypothetical protein